MLLLIFCNNYEEEESFLVHMVVAKFLSQPILATQPDLLLISSQNQSFNSQPER